MLADIATTASSAGPVDVSRILFPDELQVTSTPLKRMLLLGSCLSEGYLDRCREPNLSLRSPTYRWTTCSNRLHRLRTSSTAISCSGASKASASSG